MKLQARFLVLVLPLAMVMACGGATSSSPSSPDSFGAVNVGAGSGAPDIGDSAKVAVADPKVVITSSVDLEAGALRNAFDAISELARSKGGFVAQANIADTGRNGTASLRLRVPASRHDELLQDLRRLNDSKVTREETNAKEVSAEYTDLASRLTNLQRSEAQYQELVNRAGSVAEIVQVSAKLDDVRGQIEQTQGRLNLLGDQAQFATVSVALSLPPVSARSGVASPLTVIENVFEASLVVALVILNVLAAILVAAAWILPPAVICFFVWRRFGTRLRALGGRIASW